MRTLILIIFICFGFGAFLNRNHAQEVMSASGGKSTENQVNIEWTIGEAFTGTVDGSSIIISQGFHQPKLTVSSIFEHRLNTITFNAYPNPVRYNLYINAQSDPKDFLITILDNYGSIIHQRQHILSRDNKEFNFSDYAPGLYFVRIADASNSRVLKTFKIIKQ